MFKRILLGAIFSFFGIVFSQNMDGKRLFNFVAKILQEEYVNPKNVNIDQVIALNRKMLNQMCEKPIECTYANVKKIIKTMLSSFNDVHLVFYDNLWGYNSLGSPNPSGRFGFFGSGNSKLFLITYIYPDTPAQRAGLNVNDQIIEVNGLPRKPNELGQILRKMEVSFLETQLTVLRSGVRKFFSIRATDSKPFLPIVSLIKEDAMVIRVLETDEYREQAFHDLITKANENNIKNIIIDLRNNSGGTSLTSMKMAAAFMPKPGRILIPKDGIHWILEFNGKGISWRNADDATQTGEYEGTLNRVAKFEGKVAILVSFDTYSAGEQLAHLLQTNGVARVFGEATVGAMETSATVKEYESGAKLLYGNGKYQDLDGKWLPPRVIPDEAVPLDLDALTQGRDTQLEAALNWLKK